MNPSVVKIRMRSTAAQLACVKEALFTIHTPNTQPDTHVQPVKCCTPSAIVAHTIPLLQHTSTQCLCSRCTFSVEAAHRSNTTKKPALPTHTGCCCLCNVAASRADADPGRVHPDQEDRHPNSQANLWSQQMFFSPTGHWPTPSQAHTHTGETKSCIRPPPWHTSINLERNLLQYPPCKRDMH